MKINRYKIIYPQVAGAGVPIRVTTGTSFFMLTSYSEMIKMVEILDKEEYKYMDKVKKMIKKYATEMSDFNAKPIVGVTQKEFNVLLFIKNKLIKH